MWEDDSNQWDKTLILRKKRIKGTVLKKKNPISSKNVSSELRYSEGNKKTDAVMDKRKLDENDDGGKLPELGLNIGQRIQQARAAKGMKQKDLATKCNEKPNVIAEYEQGKAIPNNQILGKLERV